jgi:hypothetical protein
VRGAHGFLCHHKLACDGSAVACDMGDTVPLLLLLLLLLLVAEAHG